jgi:hypothetical protein
VSNPIPRTFIGTSKDQLLPFPSGVGKFDLRDPGEDYVEDSADILELCLSLTITDHDGGRVSMAANYTLHK